VNRGKRALRLPGILGPFHHIHKKMFKIGHEESPIFVIHNALACFEIKLQIIIGETVIGEYHACPTDMKSISTPYHQILFFSLTIDLPESFFVLTNYFAKVVLYHRIEDRNPVEVASGVVAIRSGDMYFSISSGNCSDVGGIVLCDIMRAYSHAFVLPIYRSPSPSTPDVFQSQSFEIIPNDSSLSDNQPNIGDLAVLSGSVTDCFSVLISTPQSEVAPPLLDHNVFKRPRFFKNAHTPPYDVIPRLKFIISTPFISPISDSDFEELKKYQEYVSSFPSGFLKFASKNILLPERAPLLPPSIAIYCLNLGEIVGSSLSDIILGSLRNASPVLLKELIPGMIQVAIKSKIAMDFIFEQSQRDDEFAVLAYWAINLEKHSSKFPPMIQRMSSLFESCLDSRVIRDIKTGEEELNRLQSIIKGVKSIQKKEDKVQYVQKQIKEITISSPFRLPVCPSFIVHSISTEGIIVFGSSLQPVKIDFLNSEKQVYSVILKYGDDMRQDSLALSAIRFIDYQLKQYGLDLCMSPYKVLPITPTYGMCEFVVGAKAISKVLEQNQGSIANFFNKNKIEQARDTFIKSCAGYSVISYVLGVGDRHLDNLLVSPNGHFLHVDFGFMFGNDPKLIPVTVRVVQEMTNAMGEEGTRQFMRLCSVSYVALRKVADELCCSLALMMDAGIPHLPKNNSDLSNTMLKKLNLDLTDEAAGKKMEDEVTKSLTAVLPWLAEMIHRLANK